MTYCCVKNDGTSAGPQAVLSRKGRCILSRRILKSYRTFSNTLTQSVSELKNHIINFVAMFRFKSQSSNLLGWNEHWPFRPETLFGVDNQAQSRCNDRTLSRYGLFRACLWRRSGYKISPLWISDGSAVGPKFKSGTTYCVARTC